MIILTLTDILDDLQIAESKLRKFERRYWINSTHFYKLYSQGLLDDGSHLEDFSEWAGHYKLKLKRESALETLSQQRVNKLKQLSKGGHITLKPQEPMLELS
ncbi:MAG: hypothetical protein B6242_10955 [Anaerolineaceae bacterium 4572_78]|nr:MAG: hypothetical protein B6242_10955 [Anaerolineaceae bacterium 4572_78]